MGKVEKGVMVVKNGKAWGVVYEDGRNTEYGWVPMEDADIHDSRFCKKPTDVTYKNSPWVDALKAGEVVPVVRVTTVVTFKVGEDMG